MNKKKYIRNIYRFISFLFLFTKKQVNSNKIFNNIILSKADKSPEILDTYIIFLFKKYIIK